MLRVLQNLDTLRANGGIHGDDALEDDAATSSGHHRRMGGGVDPSTRAASKGDRAQGSAGGERGTAQAKGYRIGGAEEEGRNVDQNRCRLEQGSGGVG